MTNDQKIQAVIDKWQIQLLMQDWDIQWKFDNSIFHDAQVASYPSEHRIKIAFKECILDYSPREFEETIIHEMMHAVIEPLDNFIRPWLNEYLPSGLHVPFWEAYNDTAENPIIDNLVRILMGAK